MTARPILPDLAPTAAPSINAHDSGIVLPSDSQLRRRLRASGYRSGGRSGGGGWLDCHALGQVQGYAALRSTLARAARELPPNLAEVATGRRVGTPTLSRASRLEVAAGLLCPGPVEWRDTVRPARTAAAATLALVLVAACGEAGEASDFPAPAPAITTIDATTGSTSASTGGGTTGDADGADASTWPSPSTASSTGDAPGTTTADGTSTSTEPSITGDVEPGTSGGDASSSTGTGDPPNTDPPGETGDETTGEPADLCEGVDPQPGCMDDGCPVGLECVQNEGLFCVPETCECDPESGEITCDASCSGGSCMPAYAATSHAFECTGAPVDFVVPPGVTKISIDAYGAEGGTATAGILACPAQQSVPDVGGLGGRAFGELKVTPGETLQINVGCAGGPGNAPGWGGGGGACNDPKLCAGGGGASDVRRGGTTLDKRVVVAAGGGGASYGCGGQGGGAGGGLLGLDATGGSYEGRGKGATQQAGGVAGLGGLAGSLGEGGKGSGQTTSAGGGGGLYGGGGSGVDGHAGGGSSYSWWLDYGGTVPAKKAGHGQIVLSHEPLPLPGPECSNYASLYDAGRKVGNPKDGLKCDDQLVEGWYRFVDAAGSRMPESPPPVHSCSTHAPGWLAGEHPSVADGIVDRTVCYHWMDWVNAKAVDNVCWQETTIQVRNCGDFVVYKLHPYLGCNSRFCGE